MRQPTLREPGCGTMGDVQEYAGAPKGMHRFGIGCDKLALILGALAWVSFLAPFAFNVDWGLARDSAIAVVALFGAVALNLAGCLALFFSDIRGERRSAYYFTALCLVLWLFGILFGGVVISVLY